MIIWKTEAMPCWDIGAGAATLLKLRTGRYLYSIE
jgi:hypothetical protein